MSSKFVSYAQNLEDVMLNRVFSGIDVGFYIDVGACDPISDSVTLAFYDRGWSGINVEPTSGFFHQLEKHRPRDLNLQCAISDAEKTLEFVTVEGAGISSVNTDVIAKAQGLGFKSIKTSVNAISLQTLVQQFCKDKEVHFLKIDVEGHESEVIAGADWKHFRPWVLVVEAVSDEATDASSIPAWDAALLQANYLFVWFDGLNRFYVRSESAHLKKHFNRPINVFDQFTLNKSHAWVQRTSLLRQSLARLLPSQVKAAIRSIIARAMGTRLR